MHCSSSIRISQRRLVLRAGLQVAVAGGTAIKSAGAVRPQRYVAQSLACLVPRRTNVEVLGDVMRPVGTGIYAIAEGADEQRVYRVVWCVGVAINLICRSVKDYDLC